MCHSRDGSLLFAILAALSILNCPPAGALPGTVEQNFAASTGQGWPIKIIKN
jgi:hypothetical protein